MGLKTEVGEHITRMAGWKPFAFCDAMPSFYFRLKAIRAIAFVSTFIQDGQ